MAESLAASVNDELWRAELASARREHGVLLARKGRLLSRVDTWNEETARRFIDYCGDRGKACAEQAIATAQQIAPSGLDVRSLIEAENSRNLIERAREESQVVVLMSPVPPLKPEGMAAAESGLIPGGSVYMPAIEQAFNEYARNYAIKGAFWAALWTCDHAWGMGEQDAPDDRSVFYEAEIRSDGAQRAGRDLVLTQTFRAFADGKLSQTKWYSVLNGAWDAEIRQQSAWLGKALGLGA